MKTTAVTVPTQAACCFCAAFLAVLSSGCATPALWRSTAAARWDPCPPVEVFLLPATNQNLQVAFSFTQSSLQGENSKTRPVLWLPQAATNLVVGKAAVRTFLKNQPAARHVLVYESDQPLPITPTDPGAYALSDPRGLTLTLHAAGAPPGPYTMPGSDEQVKTRARIVGLPFAVAIDAVLVATVVAAAALSAGGNFAPTF